MPEQETLPGRKLPPPPSAAAAYGLFLATLLGAVTAYEFLLVGLETYGYGLTRKSSYMIFMNAGLLVTLVFFLFRTQLQVIRHRRLVQPAGWTVVGLLSGMVPLFWMWAVDRWLRMGLMGTEGASFSLSPAAIIDFIGQFHEKGYWGWGISWYFDRDPLTGTWLAAWWIIEAFLIVVVPCASVGLFLNRRPQCVRCGMWLLVQEGVRRLQGSRVQRVEQALRSGDLSALEEPDRPQKGDPFTLRIDLVPCHTCKEIVYVNLVHERRLLLWMHPLPADQMQKLFKPVRGPRTTT